MARNDFGGDEDEEETPEVAEEELSTEDDAIPEEGVDDDGDEGDQSDEEEDVKDDDSSQRRQKNAVVQERNRYRDEAASAKAELEAERARLAELEARIAEEERKKALPPDFDEDKAHEEMEDAILDGNQDRARELRQQIKQYQQEQIIAATEARLLPKIGPTIKEAEINARADRIANEAIERFDILNAEAEGFDPEAMEMAKALVASYRQTQPFDVAMEMAIRRTVTAFGLQYDDSPASVSKGERVKEVRKSQAAALKADADDLPRRKPGGVGANRQTGEIDIEKMTDREWEALPDNVKDRYLNG